MLGNGLSHKVSVYVPSTDHDKALSDSDNTANVESVLVALSKQFGGATALQTLGGFMGNDSLITEKITLVYSYLEEVTESTLIFLESLAHEIKTRQNQESVAVEIDSTLYFV